MKTYVHSHTTDTWPAVPLGLVFVVGTTGLQDGFVDTTTTSNNTLKWKSWLEYTSQITHEGNKTVGSFNTQGTGNK